MDIKEKKPSGRLQISQDVIATIASVAALEIEGVHSLAQHAPSMGRFLFKNVGKKPVEIVVSDDMVEIDLGVNMGYGAKVSEVCPAVQNAVKENVQTMTGMAVSKVNVFVARIVFPSEEAAPIN